MWQHIGRLLSGGKTFDILEVAACADLVPERAQEKAEKHGVPKACSLDELLADPDIQIVVNLTIPAAHAEVALAALEAGKCVHGEKPLAVMREDGQKILQLAKEKGLLVGGAPDTFLGAGIQTCRKLIDDGWIGEPIAATAFMQGHGPEGWHPNPEFFYQPGGGPMFDMGPYYLTALAVLLGPVCRVAGSARASFPERVATSEAKYGMRIKVNTPTHIAGLMDFENGAIGTIVTSFDVWAHTLPRIEIHGTGRFDGRTRPRMALAAPVWIQRGRDERKEVPLTHGYAEQSRGIGVADMAYALRTGRPHRANGDLMYHVLDVMHSFLDSSEAGAHVAVASTCPRPASLPLGLLHGFLDE